jgi:CRP-like cAMP-binding protein
MKPLNEDEKGTFQHCVAMYQQLHSIYPEEHTHLQHQIEALLQLGENEAAELLLEQLQALLHSSGLEEDALKAEHIRKHLSHKKHAEHYYSTPFLHLASQSLVKKVFQQHKRIHLHEGDYLMHLGDTDDQMYIVLSGELAVWSRNGKGKKCFEHTLRTGEVIGELAFLDGTPRNADVLACCDVSLLVIPVKAVHKLFLEDPKVEQALRAEAEIRKVMVQMKKNPALASIPHHLQRILAKAGKWIQNEPFECIYQGNQTIQHIDLICEGRLNLVGNQNNGNSVMLNAINPDALLGCSAIIPHMEKQYPADIVCKTKVTRICFALESLSKVCELNPRLYQSILRQAEIEQGKLLQSIRLDTST